MRTVHRDDLDALVRERVARVFALRAEAVHPGLRFAEDLGADSLDRLEVVEAIEEGLRERGCDVAFADEEVVALDSVGETVDRVAARLGAGR